MVQSAAFAQSDEAQIEGFRDLTWGEHLDSIYRNGEKLNFELVEMNDENQNDGIYYRLKGDNLMIGSVLLTEIYYVFSEEDQRLFKVLMLGRKTDVGQMEFIVDYKYGEMQNENATDNQIVKQWIVKDVTLTLSDFAYNKFELELHSDWQAAAAYAKNTNVNDF